MSLSFVFVVTEFVGRWELVRVMWRGIFIFLMNEVFGVNNDKSSQETIPQSITEDGIECYMRGGKPYVDADNSSVYTGKTPKSFVIWVIGKDISRVRHGRKMLYSKQDIDRASVISGVPA